MPQRCKVLITGSSGMLGTDLWQELSESYNVSGLDVAQKTQGATCSVKCDITDRGKVAGAIFKIKPDIVAHTAAYTDVDGCELNKDKAYKINAEGAENVALACKGIDDALIYISTDFVFDGKKASPYNETDMPGPLSIYGDSKLKGEEAVKSTCKKYYIIRTSWLYGSNGKNFVDAILAKARSEKILKVVDDQVGSPTYTKDLAKAIHVLLEKTPEGQGYGVYHVSNSGSTSWYEYAKEIVRAAKINTKVMPISSKDLARPARRPSMSVLDNSKFLKFTGYGMRGWKDALSEYLRREHAERTQK